MKTLLLLRHAKSSWKEEGLADHDRPLNKRGKRDAPRMGKLLRKEGLIPDVIVTSTAKRARKTARMVAESSGYSGKIVKSETLYQAGSERFSMVLSALPEEVERVMLVGHNPDLEEFLETLIGESRGMPTAALAEIRLNIDSWKKLKPESAGRLINMWSPRELVKET